MKNPMMSYPPNPLDLETAKKFLSTVPQTGYALMEKNQELRKHFGVEEFETSQEIHTLIEHPEKFEFFDARRLKKKMAETGYGSYRIIASAMRALFFEQFGPNSLIFHQIGRSLQAQTGIDPGARGQFEPAIASMIWNTLSVFKKSRPESELRIRYIDLDGQEKSFTTEYAETILKAEGDEFFVENAPEPHFLGHGIYDSFYMYPFLDKDANRWVMVPVETICEIEGLYDPRGQEDMEGDYGTDPAW